jgi:choline dehydrogenase-like flavoprotein
VPRIAMRYSDNEHAMVADARAMATRLLDAMGFERLPDTTPFLLPVRHPWLGDATMPPGTRSHELGGARMGDDPRRSFVDAFNESWETKNLFVVDGACFPSVGVQNPTLTIMALAARAAAHFAER